MIAEAARRGPSCMRSDLLRKGILNYGVHHQCIQRNLPLETTKAAYHTSKCMVSAVVVHGSPAQCRRGLWPESPPTGPMGSGLLAFGVDSWQEDFANGPLSCSRLCCLCRTVVQLRPVLRQQGVAAIKNVRSQAIVEISLMAGSLYGVRVWLYFGPPCGAVALWAGSHIGASR